MQAVVEASNQERLESNVVELLVGWYKSFVVSTVAAISEEFPQHPCNISNMSITPETFILTTGWSKAVVKAGGEKNVASVQIKLHIFMSTVESVKLLYISLKTNSIVLFAFKQHQKWRYQPFYF